MNIDRAGINIDPVGIINRKAGGVVDQVQRIGRRRVTTQSLAARIDCDPNSVIAKAAINLRETAMVNRMVEMVLGKKKLAKTLKRVG